MGEGKFSYLKQPFTSEQLLNFVHDAWEGRETEACR